MSIHISTLQAAEMRNTCRAYVGYIDIVLCVQKERRTSFVFPTYLIKTDQYEGKFQTSKLLTDYRHIQHFFQIHTISILSAIFS